LRALHQAGYPKVDPLALKPLFEYLEFCLQQIVADNELGALLKGLEGEYVIPGPGGAFVTQMFCPPARISTPRPQSIPTTAAVLSAKIVVDRLLIVNG